jgi:hypothetical protein
MPKIAIYKALIFYIVSYDLSERLHLHVFSKKNRRSGSAKIWLDTSEVFDQGYLTDEELNLAVKLIDRNRDNLQKVIDDFRTSGKIKTLKLKLK